IINIDFTVKFIIKLPPNDCWVIFIVLSHLPNDSSRKLMIDFCIIIVMSSHPMLKLNTFLRRI
ncbi:hypothetical protein AOA60_10660, partial [Pseudomonas sp. 2822-17]